MASGFLLPHSYSSTSVQTYAVGEIATICMLVFLPKVFNSIWFSEPGNTDYLCPPEGLIIHHPL